MGTYLSIPVTEKATEEGSHLECPKVPTAWGVVDMQGWRKSMEDAHVATATNERKVFGVFDGHGGPEVARLCQLYLVSVLEQQPTWNKALEEGASDDAYETFQYSACSESDVGLALRQCFHALDRIIADPRRREELVALRTTETVPGERREITEIPPLEPTVVEAPVEEPMEEEVPLEKMVVASLMDCEPDSTEQVEDTTDENAVPAGATGETASADTETVQVSSGSTEPPLVEDSVEEEKKQEAADEAEPSVEGDTEDDSCDVDSDDSVGFEEAAEDGDSLLGSNEESDQEEEADPTSTAGKVSVMFQRLLNMGGAGSSGQLVMHVDAKAPDVASAPSPSTELTPSATPAFFASTSHGGRMICTLPDHPIHAGATAVVAVVIGKTIAVANAGDSRAVLCRDGNAFPLSYDHKPQQERELTRIRNAGGFVNQYGRINGNLNLSRSIGDLKYKQVPHVLIAEQMITAEPDIIRTTLGDDDEFILLGCDGIWDCLSNQQAVQYVRSRIQTKTPAEIGIEMLDEIISVDPRATQGIGGDNMTIMIIDLQPHLRSYRQESAREE